MANQQSNPKGSRNENDPQEEKRPGRNEPEIKRNPDSSYEGSSGSMSGNQKQRNSNDPDADMETDRESTRESGRTERKRELEH